MFVVRHISAYLSGMNPLSFVTFFTFGELGMMAALAISYLGLAPLWQELMTAAGRPFLVDARWLHMGNRGPVSTICGEVRGN